MAGIEEEENVEVVAPMLVKAFDERQALEVSLAAMETRLRAAISELVQPTIQRTTLLVADIDTVKTQVSQHTRGLQEVQLGQFKVLEQMATIASFKEDMGKWDSQRRIHEAAVDEKLESLQQKLDAYRYSLEQKESALHHLHRSIDRMASELNHALDDQESHKEHVETRIDEESRKFNQFKSELEVRLASIDLKHNALTDELWGEEAGLAKLAGELQKTNATFAALESSVIELKEGKAEAFSLDKLRADVAKMVHEANTSVSAMRQSVGNVVNDVREHFRTASETIAAHNATFVSEVRQEYQAELESTSKLRREVQQFMAKVCGDIDSLDARVASAAAKADALSAEAREEVEELNRRRKSDKSSMDTELKALKKQMSGVFENSDGLMHGMEHLYRILGVMLESDLIQCSLEWQDALDRKKIALIGVKDNETVLARSTFAEPLKPRPEVRSVNKDGYSKKTNDRGGPKGHDGVSQAPVVKVDGRCVSCSGQTPLVLSAFKMACLQYTPSPVEYSGTSFDRGDLLKRRQKMLEDARSALSAGPATLQDGSHSTVVIPGCAESSEREGGLLPESIHFELPRKHGDCRVRLPNIGSCGVALSAR